LVYTALVPVKALPEAKSRMAAHLTSEQRGELMLAMLRHVLGALRDSHVLARVSVVSPDAYVLACARQWGAHTYREEAAGHNPALTAAATRELANGSTALLTISADLPLLRPEEIARMVAQLEQHDVVLSPSRDGTGTNALLARPPLTLPYLFGPNSLPRHQAEANRLQLSNTTYSSVGLALDIDTIEDLELSQKYSTNLRDTLSLTRGKPAEATPGIYPWGCL
jgi:2-phospho-L-lactate guanylyltransferase